MIRAQYSDKKIVVDLLGKAFADNKSVNYIIKQDEKKQKRIDSLMAYSFEMCFLFGEVFLSEDKTGCALILYPDKKKFTQYLFLDLQLIIRCVGPGNLRKALRREALIKKKQSEIEMSYLWFIGVDPLHQNKGTGSKLLSNVIQYSESIKRPVYLETSVNKNVPWYKKFGFELYDELNLTYQLFFLKRSV